MHPGPWYRSRLFWFGLLGLLFLLWGWWLSTGHISVAGFTEKSPMAIGQAGGEVYGYWRSDEWPVWRGFHSDHDGISKEQASGLKLRLVEWREREPALRFVFIRYYVVILVYMAAWLLPLAWWQRRISRLLELHSAS